LSVSQVREAFLCRSLRTPTSSRVFCVSGLARLKDAENEANPLDSRFDLAYSAAHALCLAALRYHGFRPSRRYIVFQVLPDTLGLGAEVWKVLSMCHDSRNRTEYEGVLDVDDRIVSDLISACREVASKVKRLPPLPADP
jgi:hypothetical protein